MVLVMQSEESGVKIYPTLLIQGFVKISCLNLGQELMASICHKLSISFLGHKLSICTKRPIGNQKTHS